MAEVKGRVKLINPRQDVSDNFSKRELVVTTDEQYPQHVLIEFHQDKCDLLDKFVVGQAVKVSVNVRGREWINPQGEARYFNTLQGWKIDPDGEGPPASTPTQQPAMPPASAPAAQKSVYVHTATDFTEAQYLANPGWTHDLLVSQGKGRWQAASAPVSPPAAPVTDPDLPF